MSYNRDSESLNEFDEKPYQKDRQNRQNETNLYQKHKENVANQRFQGSAEGIPAISVEDFKLLRDCNRESFWYRCVPISVGFVSLMFYFAKQKNLRPKPVHIFSGLFGGWFIGKLSYRRVCEDQLIKSNSKSPFVTALRRRRGIIREDMGSDTTLTNDLQPQSSDWEQQPKDFGYGSQEFSDYRDDDNQQKEEMKSFTTYDDLRAQNRASYNRPKPFNTQL